MLASLWAAGTAQPLLREAESKLAEAEAHWFQRPYLETGPLLDLRIGAERIARERQDYESRHGRNAQPLPGALRREREALDQMLQPAAAALDAMPARRFGVDPVHWRFASLLTHVPIHGGLVHLFGNVVLLLFLGLYLESAWGRARFMGIALLSAIGAAAGYALGAPASARPFVGSSGMLAGLLTLFALHYRKALSDGFYWVGLVLGGMWLLLPPMAGWQWSLDAPGAALLTGPLPPLVTYGVYAGAALCAFAAYQLFRLTGLPAFDPEAENEPATAAPDAGKIARLRASGKHEDAFVQANAWARREPDSLDAVLTLRESAKALKRVPAERAALLKAVRLELKAGLLAAALDHWQELASNEVPKEAEPALLIRLASLLHESDDRAGASKALRAAVENAGEANRAVVASRVARAARDIDPQIAHDAAWRALQRPEIELEERQALEELLGEVIRRMPREIEAAVEQAKSADGRPVPIDIETRVRVLDAIDAIPLELDHEGVHISTSAGHKKLMRYDRIQAVSVAAIQGLSDKPVLIVDLVLDWNASAGDKLRVIRLRADRFDPRRVVPGVESPLEALRQLIATVLGRSKGVPLPDPDAARGMPFASFPELVLYQRLVLMAEGPAQPSAPRQAKPDEELPEPEIEEPAKSPEFWEFKA
ncbi:MAG TPA: rhomboid family intramembrane serine protease [Myxococcota bacterium]|nr:rhomboid family intramembrane serine protease [Myxococcota bacterium]